MEDILYNLVNKIVERANSLNPSGVTIYSDDFAEEINIAIQNIIKLWMREIHL